MDNLEQLELALQQMSSAMIGLGKEFEIAAGFLRSVADRSTQTDVAADLRTLADKMTEAADYIRQRFE